MEDKMKEARHEEEAIKNQQSANAELIAKSNHRKSGNPANKSSQRVPVEASATSKPAFAATSIGGATDAKNKNTQVYDNDDTANDIDLKSIKFDSIGPVMM